MQILRHAARLVPSIAFAFTLSATCLPSMIAFAQDRGARDASTDQVEAGTAEKTIAEQIQELSDDLITREEDLEELRAKIEK